MSFKYLFECINIVHVLSTVSARQRRQYRTLFFHLQRLDCGEVIPDRSHIKMFWNHKMCCKKIMLSYVTYLKWRSNHFVKNSAESRIVLDGAELVLALFWAARIHIQLCLANSLTGTWKSANTVSLNLQFFFKTRTYLGHWLRD